MTRALGARFRHTNLIAHDWRRLAAFYQAVFGCVVVPPQRDQRGEWLERATGVRGAHLEGVHLRLPGGGAEGPTLEVYGYDEVLPKPEPLPNRAGLGHLAFSVDDVPQALAAVLEHGGARLGEVVTQEVPGAGTLCFTYARDPEGNLLELQTWR